MRPPAAAGAGLRRTPAPAGGLYAPGLRPQNTQFPKELRLPLTLHCGRFRWSASWLMTLLTIFAVYACVGLGHWQWRRAEQQSALDRQFSFGARSVLDVGTQSTADLARYRRIRVVGHYDPAHQFLLDNQSHRGSPGYEVLTPLLRDGGPTILVNRGWVPFQGSRRQLPDVAIDPGTAGSTTVVGLLDNLPVAGLALGHAAPSSGAAWPKLTSFPSMAELAAALGRPLEARQLLLVAEQPQGYVRDWHPGGLGSTQHLSYAIQWWSFAALALVLYALLNRVRP
jgi:surfeit locus 1 family protein